MKEYISKESVIELLKALNGRELAESIVNEIPSVTTADICSEYNNTIKNEIRNLKAKQQSSNTDYYTGYMSALSTVEGFIGFITEMGG